MNRPSPEEYNPYFNTYIDLVPNGELTSMLSQNLKTITDFFNNIPKELSNYRYEENKWTIKEVLAHMIDTERVFAYRALVCLRMDHKTELSNMDEDLYAANRNVTNIAMESLIEEFEIVRKNTLKLYENVDDANYAFRAKSAAGDITARALGYIIIGHTLHHKNVVNERYLK